MTDAKEGKKERTYVGLPRGGPHGLGRPEDKRLRRVEETIILPKRLKEEATKKCANSIRAFLQCLERTGLLVVVKCREEHKRKEACIERWMKNEELIKKVRDTYLEERTYYRATGKPLNPLPRVREKMKMPDPIESEE